jgi:putative sterol carrier protein
MAARYRAPGYDPVFDPSSDGQSALDGTLHGDMATMQQCEAALRDLAKRLDEVEESLKKRHAPDRTVSCCISDLKASFSGRLTSGAIRDLVDRPNDAAQVRLTVSSDDLVAVTSGELPFATAWADGRVKIEASMLDMLKLRSLALTRQLDA